MADKDANHLLGELQEARHEVDRLRKAIRAHRDAMKEYKGAFYDLSLWQALDDSVALDSLATPWT